MPEKAARNMLHGKQNQMTLYGAHAAATLVGHHEPLFALIRPCNTARYSDCFSGFLGHRSGLNNWFPNMKEGTGCSVQDLLTTVSAN